MWTIEQTEGDRFITARVNTDLNDLDMTRFKLALKHRIAVDRASAGSVRVLFDLSTYDGPITTIVRHFRNVDGEFGPQGGDRLGMLVNSSLQKALARPELRYQTTHLFVSENAARTWLNA